MKEITRLEDTKDKYSDIINMKHHVSKKHKQMSIEARAAQFAPFAALTGYEDSVKETARVTNKRIENSESIESEEETVDLNFLQEQKIKQSKDKFLLRKKRKSKEKIEKKNRPSLNWDVNKYKEQRNYVRTERKSNINSENLLEYQNFNKMSKNKEDEFEYKRQKKIDLISKFQHQ